MSHTRKSGGANATPERIATCTSADLEAARALEADALRRRRIDSFNASALQLSQKAAEVEEIANSLDDSSALCPTCDARSFRNWPQHQVRVILLGIAEKMRNVSDTLRRRSDDPDFLGDLHYGPDAVVAALSAVNHALLTGTAKVPDEVAHLVHQAMEAR